MPTHSPSEARAGGDERHEADRAADVGAEDHRPPAEPVGQPARDERHRHATARSAPAYIRFVGRSGRCRTSRDVQQREEVRDAEAAAAAAEDRRRGTVCAGSSNRPTPPGRSRTEPCCDRRGRSAPVSRTQRKIARPMSAAGIPKTIDAPRQPTAARSGRAGEGAMTVPTLPPEMWALIAKPRRSGGNCSARRPLPTGCCGEPPMREMTLARRTSGSWWPAPGPRTRRRTAGRRAEERAPRDRRVTKRVARLDEAGATGRRSPRGTRSPRCRPGTRR